MWGFLAREANWTEIITNTLALGFSLMTIGVITYAVIFNPDILATVGSVTSGITGVILGYYFNRERLRRAQRQADTAVQERDEAAAKASMSDVELTSMSEAYADAIIRFRELLIRLEEEAEE